MNARRSEVQAGKKSAADQSATRLLAVFQCVSSELKPRQELRQRQRLTGCNLRQRELNEQVEPCAA